MNNKTKWIYATSGLGKDAMYAMSTIMVVFFTTYVGLPGWFIGTMFMVVRVFDAINDPIMGTIVDNTKSKWGKFRPWILTGALLNGIITIFVFFSPDLAPEGTAMMIYVTVFYTLWGVSYTLMDIPFWSMIPALAKNKEDRESISSLTRLFTSLGYFLVSAPYLVVVALLGSGQSDTEKMTDFEAINGFFILALIVSIVFVVSQVVMVTNVKEEEVVSNNEKISIGGMIRLLKENDQLLVVMVVVVISNFVLYITSTMAFYYISYDIGDSNLLLPFLTFGGLVQVLGVVLYPSIAKKISRKSIFNIQILLQVAAFVGLFINAFILSNSIVLMFVFGVLVFFGQGLSMVLQTVLLTDTVEYGELVTGRRSEAIVFSVQTFVVKLATGLSMGVVGVGLTLMHYDPDLDVQGSRTIWGIRLLMFILPVFGMLLSRYIFNKKHIIDEAKYLSIVEELNIKRGEVNGEVTN